jgi:4,5:9,10-diseco-3-hydroxy-5,9,17-trioxoandrosta-1(10),2-diene-4-oate hydrolase
MVNLLGGFIDEMGWKSVTVIGNSMGGLLAISMALNLKGRVSRLVLAGSAGLGREVSLLLRLARIPWLGELALLPMGLRPVAHYSLRRLFADPSRLPNYLVDVTCDNYKRRSIRDNLLHATRIGVSFGGQDDSINSRGRLHEIKVPTLLIWGRQDGVIPLQHGEIARELIAGSKLTVIDDCGHVPQIEHPDRFVEEVERFLARTTA